MRIWDVSPGYLNRQSLLAEHRELHGLYSVVTHRKKGYSRHPETLRWVFCLSGLARRHALLVAEMQLRGYSHLSPLDHAARDIRWPDVFVTPPAAQFSLLMSKYAGRLAGRIPLPSTAQELWAHHKYSVMARDPARYRSIGRRVAGMRRRTDISVLAEELVLVLRQPPCAARFVNALEHIWGHVSDAATEDERRMAHRSPSDMLWITRQITLRVRQPYILASTVFPDLAVFAADA